MSLLSLTLIAIVYYTLIVTLCYAASDAQDCKTSALLFASALFVVIAPIIIPKII